MDEVVVAKGGARAPKRAEFQLAKRLQREIEELLAKATTSSLRKGLGRRPDSQSRQERKELKSAATRQRNSRRRQRRPEAAPMSPLRLLRAGRRPEM